MSTSPEYKNNPDGTRSKTGTWQVNFYYIDRADGQKKKKHKRGFRTKKDGEQYEREFRAYNELKRGEAVTPGAQDVNNITFSDLVKEYRTANKNRIREHTWKTKDMIIDKKLIPYFGKMNIKEITSANVDDWIDQLCQNTKDGRPYSDAYKKEVFGQLSTLFNFAVSRDYMSKNPARGRGNFNSSEKKKLDFWTLEEYKEFIKAVDKKSDTYMAFQILYWCGVRVGELLALTPSDFDFLNNKLSITKSYQRLNGRDVITAPKTKKSVRTIKIPAFLAQEVKSYIATLYDVKSTNGRIFTFTKHKLHHDMIKYCEASGVKRIRIHDLRHSHVSYLINKGFTAIEIADRMGHEAIDITFTYAHLFPGVQDRMAQQMDQDFEE